MSYIAKDAANNEASNITVNVQDVDEIAPIINWSNLEIYENTKNIYKFNSNENVIGNYRMYKILLKEFTLMILKIPFYH